METLQWYDFMRITTIFILFTSIWFLGTKAFQNWSTYTNRMKDVWWVLNALILLLIEINAEQIYYDNDLAPKTVLGFIVALVCLKAAIKNESFIKEDTVTRSS